MGHVVRSLRWVGGLAWTAGRAVLPLQAQAVDPHAVQPERPTVATHAGTVARGWFEVETGVERDWYQHGDRGVGVPTVLKIGLARRVQLSLQLPVVAPPGASAGVGDLSAGLKWRLLDDAPVLGDFAILPSIKAPTGSQRLGRGTATTDVSLLLISSRNVGDLAIDLNAGVTRRSGDGREAPRTATLWTASFGFPFGRQLGWVGELFGFPATSGPAGQPSTVAVLTGPTLVVRPWLALDAGVIRPLTGPQPRALYAGLVWNAGRL